MTIHIPGVSDEEAQAWAEKIAAAAPPMSEATRARLRAIFAPYVAEEEAEEAERRAREESQREATDV